MLNPSDPDTEQTTSQWTEKSVCDTDNLGCGFIKERDVFSK